MRLEGHRSIMDVVKKLLESVSKDADVLEDLGLRHNDIRESTPKRTTGASTSADADCHEPRSPRNGNIEWCTNRLVQRLRVESERGGSHNILLVRKFRRRGCTRTILLGQIGFDLKMYRAHFLMRTPMFDLHMTNPCLSDT